MTVIAAYGSNESSFLFADTLITTKAPLQSGKVTLPISIQEFPASMSLDEKGQVHIYSYYKKVTQINDYLVITYAGDVNLASKIVTKIKESLEYFDGNNYMDALSQIQKIIEPFRSQFGESIIILGLIICIDGKETRICPFGIGFAKTTFDNPIFPHPLFIAGSGAEVMRENIASILASQQLSLLDGGNVPSTHVPLTATLTSIGLQHYRELTGGTGLDKAFGGPFEIALVELRPNGLPKLRLLDDISFSYWNIEKTGKDKISFGPAGPIIFQKYIFGALISATMIINKHEINLEERVVMVDCSRAVVSHIVMKESAPFINLIESFIMRPVFRPTMHIMYFIDRTFCGRMHMALHFDNYLFSVEYTELGFKMMLRPEMLNAFRDWYFKDENQ